MLNPFVPSGQSMMVDQDTKKLLVRSALTGTVLAVAGSVIYGNGDITVMGKNVPASVPLFISGAIGSVIADKSHKAVSDAIPTVLGSKLGDYTGMVVGGAVCAAASAGVMKVAFSLPNEVLPQAAGLGFGSYVAADVLEPKLLEQGGQLIF